MNNSCVVTTFEAMQERFAKLYKRKFYLHHYLEYMEEAAIVQANDTVSSLVDEYLLQTPTAPPTCTRQLRPIGTHFL